MRKPILPQRYREAGHMKLIYQGKTKDVYENPDGTITLKLKDDATGKDGVFDPGENAVGLSIEGLGRESLKLSAYYFELLKSKNIPTHYLFSNLPAAEMTVLPAQMFGKGIEFICRLRADGSFLRRYGAYTSSGAELGFLVEVTIKDDHRQDPPITEDALAALRIMTFEEYKICKKLTQKTAWLISEDLRAKGLELFDIKFEFGKNGSDILLIDEISAGCMRVYKDGEIVKPMDLGGFII